MLFHRVDFLLFFAVIWLLYVVLTRRAQNVLLLAASIVFYGSWDWRFLGLILLSASVDYSAALAIERWPAFKRLSMLVSVAVNLGILFTFKYFNFFIESASALMRLFGLQPDFPTLHVILPVGLSFYTFQTMSYTIDVYMGRTKARSDFLTVALFVCYFPQLVAGPVERAGRLLPQLEGGRQLDWEMISDGCWFLFLGLFKKIAIANLLAAQVDSAFATFETASLAAILKAGVAFSLQLYADFSGYSDMAIGLSMLLGIRLSRNFRQPCLFAGSFDEFWKRWHITMTSWFRDYLYAPLRGRSASSWRQSAALVGTFSLVGLWHGANWTFLLWGMLQGLLLWVERAGRRSRSLASISRLPFAVRCVLVATVLGFVNVLFRIPSLSSFPTAVHGLISWSDWPSTWDQLFPWLNVLVLLVGVDAVCERRRAQTPLRLFPALAQFALLFYFALAILSAGGFHDDPYVYFQF